MITARLVIGIMINKYVFVDFSANAWSPPRLKLFNIVFVVDGVDVNVVDGVELNVVDGVELNVVDGVDVDEEDNDVVVGTQTLSYGE